MLVGVSVQMDTCYVVIEVWGPSGAQLDFVLRTLSCGDALVKLELDMYASLLRASLCGANKDDDLET